MYSERPPSYMQSTGHSSTQARSVTSMQGFPITYVMVPEFIQHDL
ncbi:hypothetical protein MPS_0012 [Mycobacterium pseudoshottsii JCM 15466]|nr:hypothetical protein MPS_0012 [Mycobacterium pseudoshottsii JCM 15466]